MPTIKTTAKKSLGRRPSLGRKPTGETTGEAIPKKTKQEEDNVWEFEQMVNQRNTTPSAKSRGRGWLLATFIVIVLILGAAWLYIGNNETLEKEFKFQAISLDNGQVYYAKVVKEDALNIYLDEVYYIQAQEMTVPPEEEDGEPQIITVPALIKRGEELHKPSGWLQINRDKVLALEEIGEDSEILLEIDRLNQ